MAHEMQRKLLGDAIRNRAFKAALQRALDKGFRTLIDVGSGTGYLGMLAAKLGFTRATLFEKSKELAHLSWILARTNGVDNRLAILPYNSQTYVPFYERALMKQGKRSENDTSQNVEEPKETQWEQKIAKLEKEIEDIDRDTAALQMHLWYDRRIPPNAREKTTFSHLVKDTLHLDPKWLKADVIVSETLGNFALEEGIIENLVTARLRMLNPGGIVIPRGLTQFIAPITNPRLWNDLHQYEKALKEDNLYFAPFSQIVRSNIYVRRILPEDIAQSNLQLARVWDSIDFMQLQPMPGRNHLVRTNTVEWRRSELSAPGVVDPPPRLYGFASFWKANLIDEFEISTSPNAPPTHWEQVYMPLRKPIQLAVNTDAREVVRVTISADSRQPGCNVIWQVSLLQQDGDQETVKIRQTMNLAAGYLQP